MGMLSLIRRFNKIEDGCMTTGGLRLKLNPSLSDEPEVKFAAFSDDRMYSRDYLKFQPFLPIEIVLLSPPLNKRNCFGFVLDKEDFISSSDFKLALKDYVLVRGDLTKGDIIVYGGIDTGSDIEFLHAGIYLGKNIVMSVWGKGGPLVQHPLDEVLPTYYHSDLGIGTLEYRMR